MLNAINTNIIALQTQNNLENSQMSLSKSIQRLSSGLRINSAQDDPAGLAISSRMQSQLSGLLQATQNANTGVSMLQTADGGLASAASLLQSMRGLAVEAANGTNSPSDLQSLQAQITQLQAQIQQISTTTQYNGINLLDGSLSNLQFQVGANAGQTINFGIANAQEAAIGNAALTFSGTSAGSISSAGTAATAGSEVGNVVATTLTIQGNGNTQTIAVGASATTTKTSTAQYIATQVNNSSALTGVRATASTQALMTLAGSGTVNFNLIGDANAGTTTANINVSYAAGSGVANVVTAINQNSGVTGITATAGTTAGTILLSNTTGANIDVETQGTTTAGQISMQGYFYTQSATTGVITANLQATATALGTAASATAGVIVGGNVQFSSDNAYTINSGSAGTNTLFAANGTSYGDILQTVGSINVTSTTNGQPTGANDALNIIDAAIANINASRASIGALQNRFTASASNLQTASLNLSSSLSTVQDTNFASETTNLSRAQILQQAGTAMLAQANSLPNGVLALLR